MPRRDNPDYIPLEMPDEAVRFDVEDFDAKIRDHGVPFVHWRAMRCPVGMSDPFDARRPHEDHEGCSNGFIYTPAGTLRCLFSGNSTKLMQLDIGLLTGSSVMVTLPRTYDALAPDLDGDPVLVAPFDRMYLPDAGIEVVHWQLFAANESGVDKLSFPIVRVIDVVDADGRRYYEGDYTVEDGKLRWIGTNRPGFDPQLGKDKVCSARYTYRPYWYVKQLVHEVRVARSDSEYATGVTVARMPQALILQREYVFEKEERDPQAPTPESPRQWAVPTMPTLPPATTFGPR